jgi:hypothetical protein
MQLVLRNIYSKLLYKTLLTKVALLDKTQRIHLDCAFVGFFEY